MVHDPLKPFGALIGRLLAGSDLSREEAAAAFAEILGDRQSEIHQGAFLAALTAKGPTPDEIAGAWAAILDRDTVTVAVAADPPLVDNCGTGMDGAGTFNISTAAAIVAAAGGCRLARHGARAVSSACGTVDVCQALGVDVDCPVQTVCDSIEKAGIGLFNAMSPRVHPGALGRILSRLRFGSILNIAASLANPARPTLAVRGVYRPELVLPIARAMRSIGYRRALVFHGRLPDGRGMDELAPAGDNTTAELHADGRITTRRVDPARLGLSGGDPQLLSGSGVAAAEARSLVRLIGGRENGIRREAVCLNAAAILYISDRVADLAEGVALASRLIEDGRVLAALERWVAAQQTEAGAGKERFQSLVCAAMSHPNGSLQGGNG